MGAGLGKLVLRGVAGGLLAGHGAQKLWGSFDGPGLEGTTGFMRSMNLEPAPVWARLAGGSEFAGGLLMATGFMHPAGPLATIGAMAMATKKAHWGKPIWNADGGAELPVMFMAVAASQIISGPGPIALDTIFRSRLPGWALPAGVVGIAAALWYAGQQEQAVAAGGSPRDADAAVARQARAAATAAAGEVRTVVDEATASDSAVGHVTTTVKDAVVDLAASAKDRATGIVSEATDRADEVVESSTGALADARDATGERVAKAKDAADDVADDAEDLASDVVDDVKDATGDLSAKAKSRAAQARDAAEKS